MSWIPLLSWKPLAEFDPTEFKAHVRSLYNKPAPKSRAAPKMVSARLTKKGAVSLIIKRKPKWISREEIAEAAKNLLIEERLVWNYVAEKKIKVSSAEAEGEINFQLSTIPW